MARVRLTVSIDAELYQYIEKKAANEGRSTANMAVYFILLGARSTYAGTVAEGTGPPGV